MLGAPAATVNLNCDRRDCVSAIGLENVRFSQMARSIVAESRRTQRAVEIGSAMPVASNLANRSAGTGRLK